MSSFVYTTTATPFTLLVWNNIQKHRESMPCPEELTTEMDVYTKHFLQHLEAYPIEEHVFEIPDDCSIEDEVRKYVVGILSEAPCYSLQLSRQQFSLFRRASKAIIEVICGLTDTNPIRLKRHRMQTEQ